MFERTRYKFNPVHSLYKYMVSTCTNHVLEDVSTYWPCTNHVFVLSTYWCTDVLTANTKKYEKLITKIKLIKYQPLNPQIINQNR